MDGFDNATWQALGLVLTTLGLGASAVVWSRRGAVSGLRGVAWSLLPIAFALTGVLRLGWEVAESVFEWATRLVFSPVVWLGLVIAAVSVVLFVVTGFARRRTQRRSGATARPAPAADGGGRRSALPKERSTKPAAAPPAKAAGSRAGEPGDDLADIEEILRRHGIQ